MKKMKIVYPIIIILLWSACNGIQVSERLDQVDSLIVREQYDSACALMKDITKAPKTDDEQAHYYLLETQLGYLTNTPLSSDTLLDKAIIYYNKVGNNQKLANAYYYKSYRSEKSADYPQAILYCKKAEQLAENTNDILLQCKIAEHLSYLNCLCDNYQLQLQYAKKALNLSEKTQNNSMLAYSYHNIGFAFAILGQYDSAYAYVERTIPYIKYIEDSCKVGFLTNIGQLYKENNPEKAKEYFQKALTYGEHPGTLEHLADVYYADGNQEEAYRLWKKALTLDSRYEKDYLVYSILSYDIEHGNLEEASKNLDKVIAIKDSMLYSLRNDTIKDLQLRFDHEVAMHEADKNLISTQWMVMGLAFIVGVLAFYIYLRRMKEKAQEKEYQLQLCAYTTEINELEAKKEKAHTKIKDLESTKDQNIHRIIELEEEAKEADNTIEELNKNIQKLLDNMSPKLKHARMLYDYIEDGGNAGTWSYEEQGLYNYYYEITKYHRWNRLRKVKRVNNLNPHYMFYLILKDMGKSDEEVKRILVLSQEGLRSIRNRTKPIKPEDS